jgi:uncharacterized protein YndB with AHSA1/START domain
MHIFALVSVLLATTPAAARRIEKDVVINAPVAVVWKAWTDAEASKVFLAPSSKIEMEPGGAYEMYFMPSQPAGLKGGEGNRVIDFDRERFLLITWNAPPKFGALRDERTYVLITLAAVDDSHTRVRLTHFGWRKGEEWAGVYAYFEKAWDIVLGRLASVDFRQ